MEVIAKIITPRNSDNLGDYSKLDIGDMTGGKSDP